MPAAIIFREGLPGDVIRDRDPFLPHVVNGRSAKALKFKMTPRQAEIRRRLYGKEIENIYGEGQTVEFEITDNIFKPSQEFVGKETIWFRPYEHWSSYITQMYARQPKVLSFEEVDMLRKLNPPREFKFG